MMSQMILISNHAHNWGSVIVQKCIKAVFPHKCWEGDQWLGLRNLCLATIDAYRVVLVGPRISLYTMASKLF